MASEDMVVINSSNPRDCTIIQVGYDLAMNEKDVSDVGEAVIFRVPKSLRKDDRLYSPHLVSIGPFHYGKKKLKSMETSKSEAVRRMQARIQKNNPDASIKSYVEHGLLLKDEEIRKFYGECIPFTPIKLAWIVARDACFIFEFLVNYLSRSTVAEKFHKDEVKAFSWKYDAVFDVSYQNPMREGLINDILVLENQIPLWVLKDILQVQMGSPEAADKKLDEFLFLLIRCVNRQDIFTWNMGCSYKKCSHVLEVLYLSMLGENLKDYEDKEALQMPTSRNSVQIYIMKGVDSMKPVCERWCKMCLGLLSSNNSPDEEDMLNFAKLPTALELMRAGVKIQPVTEKIIAEKVGPAIRWIRFDEKTATLYLPQITVTPQLYSVMSNIIAMEVSIREEYYPGAMTQYVLFMDELMDNDEDVAVLRKEEVINNFLESNQKVADLFNSLASGITPDKGCIVIENARRGLHSYMRKKLKILVSEFVTAYCSKPWLVVGSVAAVLLLLMTMSQVLCMFITCNP